MVMTEDGHPDQRMSRLMPDDLAIDILIFPTNGGHAN